MSSAEQRLPQRGREERAEPRTQPGAERAGGQATLRSIKLTPPRIPPTMVHRPRLDDLLTRGVALPATLVSAGPGSGKTLAVAAWAASKAVPGPVAWLSVDDADNEPATFWSDVLAALIRSGGVPRRNLLRDLAPTVRFDVSHTDLIRAGLGELSQPVVLVLDDLHNVNDARVLDVFGRMLEHPPRCLRVVMVTRADPPLPLHRLRVSGELAEIRTRELAFNESEADHLFGQHGLALTAAQRAALLARTEGWAAGLRLAAMSLQRGNLDEGIAAFSGDEHTVAEYLTGEVLDRQSPAIREFLLRTSVTDRLSGSLADAITGRTDGSGILERLANDNALVIELGAHREWFRYHPLLRELLLHRLRLENPPATQDAHTRAATWFSEHDEPVEAIRHAALAGDWDLVGRITMNVALPAVLSRDGPALVAALAPAAERAAVAPTVELLICSAACHLQRHAYHAMEDDVAHARRLLGESAADHPVADFLLTLYTLTSSRFRGNIPELISSGELALKLLEWAPVHDLPAAPKYRVVAQTNLGVGLVWSGRNAEAEEHLVASLAAVDEAQMELPHLDSLSHLALVNAAHGHLREAEEAAALSARLAERRGWTGEPQIAEAYLALAVIHLHRFELAEADRYVALTLSRDPEQMDQAAYVGARLTQVRLHVARGDAHQVVNAIAAARTAALRAAAIPEFLARWATVVEAEALLLAGDPAGAIGRIGVPDVLSDNERVCLVRANLALGRSRQAAELLRPLLDEPAPGLEVRVWAWLLAAMIADHARQDGVAMDAISRALVMAAPERMRLPFVMLGPRIAVLLRRQQTTAGSEAALATEILAGLGMADGPVEPPAPLAEPLTQRELTVLRYLPTMLTNTEIGADLNVTANTVKAHLKALYRKLGVISRSQAVRRARDLELL